MDEPDPELLEGGALGHALELWSVGHRRLQEWSDNSNHANSIYICVAIALVLFAGCMSGLTLVSIKNLHYFCVLKLVWAPANNSCPLVNPSINHACRAFSVWIW